MTGEGFQAAYRVLEARMKVRADADGDVFLPSPEPSAPVDYFFICMEPSLAVWAPSPEVARSKVAAGFRNFLFSMEDFILHFAIREFLCAPGQRYHITDISKGAMLVKMAEQARTNRYDNWYPLLLEELEILGTRGARVFAVGAVVARYLAQRGFQRPVTQLIHYSNQAARARKTFATLHGEAFAQFKGSVSLERLLATAADVLLAAGIPLPIRNETTTRLGRLSLSESREQLIFAYKTTFEAARPSALSV